MAQGLSECRLLGLGSASDLQGVCRLSPAVKQVWEGARQMAEGHCSKVDRRCRRRASSQGARPEKKERECKGQAKFLRTWLASRSRTRTVHAWRTRCARRCEHGHHCDAQEQVPVSHGARLPDLNMAIYLILPDGSKHMPGGGQPPRWSKPKGAFSNAAHLFALRAPTEPLRCPAGRYALRYHPKGHPRVVQRQPR